MKSINSCQKMLLKGLLAIFILLALQASATAAPDQTAGAIAKGFNSFMTQVDDLTSSAIKQQDFTDYVDNCYVALVIFLFVFTGYKYAVRAAGLPDLISAAVLALIVKTLMVGYPDMMAAFWNMTTGVAGSLQKGMVGTDDIFFAPKFLSSVMQAVVFSGSDWTAPFRAVKGALIVFMSSGMMLLLSMLSYISAIWGFWGFQLAKLMGLMFFPSLLFKQLSFLFDGWLRFVWGFIVYYIIARLNLVLVACAISLYLGIGLPPTPQITPIEFPSIESVFEIFGLLTFTLVGLLALFSTGKFAATIVSGAGGGGMGSAVLGMARLAGKFAAG